MLDLEEIVPECHAHRIEYPGYIKDLDKALHTLGDEEGLQKAANTSMHFLPLQLRPDCAEDHRILGIKQHGRGLLVKIKKKKQKGQLSAEIVARVTGTFKFTGLADFQVAPDADLSVADTQEVRKFEEELEEKEEPLLAIPPLFAHQQDPIDYQFRSYYGNDNPDYRAVGQGRLRGHMAAHMAQWIVQDVPSPLEINLAAFKEDKAKFLEALRKLFLERKIWSSLDLHERVSGVAFHEAELVGKLAYVFRSGPFQGLWIHRGYDPRKDSKAAKYQAVKWTLPPSWEEQIKKKQQAEMEDVEEDLTKATPDIPVSTSYSKLCRFEAVPKQSAILQVCDLKDEEIQKILADSAAAQSKCTKETGWFHKESWEKIAETVNQRFLSVNGSTGQGESGEERNILTRETDQNASKDDEMVAEVEKSTEREDASGAKAAGISHSKGTVISDAMMESLTADWTTEPQSGRRDFADEVAVGDLDDEEQEGEEEFEIFEEDSDEDEEEGNDESDEEEE